MTQNTESTAIILANVLNLSADAVASISEREQLSLATKSLEMFTEQARRAQDLANKAQDQTDAVLLELEESRRQIRKLLDACQKWEAIANGLLAQLVMVTRPPGQSERVH
ncbi:hypothetical protein [Methylococcus geothermalis]|uniref:Uncharacterized protein n=1 Tax=Methylococcus geothermalis TaxID=2681310 RepID=A0A858Q6X0_9GAMM|nr:hypothetical protein [Methylococcus geothermalis]QJD29580.1 hypothetical protein GNH96_06080 [Methylococcus geothermalis]